MSDWPKVRLGELGAWYGGGTPSKNRPDFWAEGTFPWLSPKDMGPETLSGTRDQITQAAVDGSAARLISANSVAIVVRSGILERKLPVAVVPFVTTINQDMRALLPGPGVSPGWVAWALRAHEQQLLDTCRKRGTTVASLEGRRLMDFSIPLPDLPMQRRIVAILEDHLSRLEFSGRLNESILRRVKALRLSTLSNFWHRADQYAGLSPVASAGRIITGRTPSANMADAFGGEILFVTPGDVGKGGLVGSAQRTLSPSGAASSRLIGPDAVVVVCIGATIGKVGWLDRPAATNQQLNAIDLRDGRILPRYMAAALATPQFQRQISRHASNTTIPLLNKSNFSRLQVPLPDVARQQQLLQELDVSEAAISRLTATQHVLRIKVAGLRYALLSAAFSGQFPASW